MHLTNNLLRSRVLWALHLVRDRSDDAHWDMGTWVEKRATGIGASSVPMAQEWQWCNTAACLAGHIIMLAKPDSHESGSFALTAANWFGLLEGARLNDHLTSRVLFTPGNRLRHITRDDAIRFLTTLYEEGVAHWLAVMDITRANRVEFLDASYDTGEQEDGCNRISDDSGRYKPVSMGERFTVGWADEPDKTVADLFLLRDRINRAYWGGRNAHEVGVSTAENSEPVCIVTGMGALLRSHLVTDDQYARMNDTFIRVVPHGLTQISDVSKSNALALVDIAILHAAGALNPVEASLAADKLRPY